MRRILLVALTVAVTVGLAGAPASAQTKVRQDKVGDAPANVDIRSAKVQNNQAKLAITARFTRVQKGRTTLTATFIPGTLANPEDVDSLYGVLSVPISRGRYATQLYRIDAASEDTADEVRVPCPGLTSRWKRGSRGYARIVVPQSCLGVDAGTLVTSVVSFDKRELSGRSALREARRGDEDVDDIPFDFLDSFVTTRRG